jgi:hypothetical protein
LGLKMPVGSSTEEVCFFRERVWWRNLENECGSVVNERMNGCDNERKNECVNERMND